MFKEANEKLSRGESKVHKLTKSVIVVFILICPTMVFTENGKFPALPYEPMIDFLKLPEGLNFEEIIGQYVENISLPVLEDNVNIYTEVKEAFDGKEIKKDVFSEIGGNEHFFRVRFIPTVFEDGQHAVALIVKDNTAQVIAQKSYKKNRKK